MTESESVALPFGDTPLSFVLLTKYYYTHFKVKIKRKFKKIVNCNSLSGKRLELYRVKFTFQTQKSSKVRQEGWSENV